MNDWTATVHRINPASDVLVVNVHHQLNAETAYQIKRTVEGIMPGLKVLILDQGIEVAVITKRRAKTLVRAAKAQHR